MVQITRRKLVAASALAFFGAPALSEPAFGASLAQGTFTHGVASGDPTANAVILWTRFQPTSRAGRAAIGWEIAEDEAFKTVAKKGRVFVSVATDWCAKVDAQGLKAGTRYFYRFTSGGDASPVGQTRTAPEGDVDSLTFALFSCSNKPFGYFHAYGHAAARDEIDLCFHVGDYIYEYPRGTYPSAAEAIADRVIEPETEIVKLSDYHARYASYRSDPDLQEIHRRKPFVCVWDDHELANDAYIGGAQNHQPDTEGEWTVRRAAAAKAYADWMPMRPQATPLHIHRRLDWGTLATLIMLDTRIIGRDKQLSYQTALAPVMGQGDAAMAGALQKFAAEQMADPNRSMLGMAQETWLRDELIRSKGRGATWQVLGQQLVTANQIAPMEMVSMLPADAGEAMKLRAASMSGVGRLGLGWNLDSWSGYLAARERLLNDCVAYGVNPLILSGDSHNAWFSSLQAKNARYRVAAVEMAGGSVSSPGMESIFKQAAAGAREAAVRAANPELAFCDVTNRGYATGKLTRAGLKSEWVAFADIKTKDAAVAGVTKGEVAASATAGPGAWTF